MESRRALFRGALPEGHLQETQTGPKDAFHELGIAELHLTSSDSISVNDPVGAYQLSYEAARKAIQALLMADGLRITSAGGHYAFVKIAESGFSYAMEWRHFRTMRQIRNKAEYPDGDFVVIDRATLQEAITVSEILIAEVRKLLNE